MERDLRRGALASEACALQEARSRLEAAAMALASLQGRHALLAAAAGAFPQEAVALQLQVLRGGAREGPAGG
jgi:hypothetical protein